MSHPSALSSCNYLRSRGEKCNKIMTQVIFQSYKQAEKFMSGKVRINASWDFTANITVCQDANWLTCMCSSSEEHAYISWHSNTFAVICIIAPAGTRTNNFYKLLWADVATDLHVTCTFFVIGQDWQIFLRYKKTLLFLNSIINNKSPNKKAI